MKNSIHPTRFRVPTIMRLILCPLFALLLVGCAVSHETKPREAKSSAAVTATRPLPPGTRLKVRTTAYTQTEPGGWANAVGGRLRYNMTNSSAASDWSWLPVGTRFRMLCTGRVHVIEDYGSALVGRRTIDLFYPSRSLMRQWGMRHVEIEILQWGSPRRSLEVLGPRRRHWHTRKMVAALTEQSRGYPGHFRRITAN
jgi:3D (Asp-Asp-Asp) domain-containing protein